MAAITGAFKTYESVGNREDLSDFIYDISPTKTPFQTMIGKSSASGVYHEWQTEDLAAASTANAQLEGAETTRVTSAPTVRIGNYCQILSKNATVSGTQEAISKAGRKKEMAHQVLKRSKELKRDLEATITGVQGQVAGAAGTARKLRAIGSWLSSNESRQTTTTTGVAATAATAAPTDGTQRALTETLLKAVLLSAHRNGSEADTLMVGPFNKQAVSGFTGRTQARQNVDANTILGAASIYSSDWGDIKVVTNLFQRERDAWLVQPDMAGLAWLRPWTSHYLGKIGDADTKEIIGEVTLVIKNEKAHGVVADLTAS
jgi:hypothetical protein